MGHRLDRVAQQVPDHLPHLARRPFDARVRIHLHQHADVGRPLLVLEGLGDLARDLGQIEGLLLLGARPGVLQQVGDQAVEAVHLAHGDVDQLPALAVGPGRPAQHLDRSRDAGQRVADLVGDARRQPPDRGQALGPLHLDLHAAQLGQILEMDHAADDLAGVVGQRGGRDAEVAHAAVGSDGIYFVAPHRPHRSGHLQHQPQAGDAPGQRVAQGGGLGDAEDLASRAVDRRDEAVQGHGDQPGRQATDGVLVQQRQIAGVLLVPGEPLASPLGLTGEVQAQRAHGGDRRHVEHQPEEEVRGGHLPGVDALPRHDRQQPEEPGNRHRQHDQGAGGGHVGRPVTLGQQGDRDDLDHEQDGERALGAPSGVHQDGDEEQVHPDLQVGEADQVLDLGQQDGVDDRGGVGEGQQGEQEAGEHPPQAVGRSVGDGQADGAQQQHRRQHHPEQHQVDNGAIVLGGLTGLLDRPRLQIGVRRRRDRRHPRGPQGGLPAWGGFRLGSQRRAEGGRGHTQPPLMFPAISKMGMYMAMTRPPMMPPRNTIISGSMRLVIEATATSTSSS